MYVDICVINRQSPHSILICRQLVYTLFPQVSLSQSIISLPFKSTSCDPITEYCIYKLSTTIQSLTSQCAIFNISNIYYTVVCSAELSFFSSFHATNYNNTPNNGDFINQR